MVNISHRFLFSSKKGRLIRLSIGLENVDDIIGALDNALKPI
jgi:cystathionine beta-lyase/cystathionine gamma-synthase